MTIHGLWAATPTPWDESGKLSPDSVVRNVHRYAEVRVDGVYTSDSDGEFYAIELPEFQELVRVFARSMEEVGLDAAVGVTWTSTRGIIDRMRVVREQGVRKVHVTFPYWMPLAPSDVDRFFEDLANAVPEIQWIHYNTPRAHVVLGGKDYARIASTYPDQLIGTKVGTFDILKLVDIIAETPHLAHFGSEYTLVPGYQIGTTGIYSYWVNTLPTWMREFVDACESADWEKGWAMQWKLWEWERTYVPIIRGPGHLHGIVGKARAALTTFVEDTGYTQPPYYPVAPERQQELQGAFDRYWGDIASSDPLLTDS